MSKQIDLEKLREQAEDDVKRGREWSTTSRDVLMLLDHIAALEKDAALMKDCVGTLRFIRDTFQKDLNQGYITKDKQFFVEMAKPYLAAIDTAMEESNAKAD